MTKKQRVALYTRVSTEDQARDGFSLEVQRNHLRQHANAMNWEIFCSIPGTDVYEDDGYSAFSMDRPAFQILRQDAHQRRFDLVLVYKQDRLSRNLRELLIFLEELDDLNIGFKSATEPFDTTNSAGKLAIQMLGSYAEFERNRLIERVFPGMIAGAKRGHWQGARYAPFGYLYNKELKRLEVNSAEAETVKKIFQLYTSGSSTIRIAKEFLTTGVRSREGHQFYPKLINDILKNKVYLGVLIWNRKHYSKKLKTKSGKGYRYITNDPSEIIEVANTHDAIITKEEFEAARQKLAKNRKTCVIRFKDNIYHLSGVLFCKKCGLPYRGNMLSHNSKTHEKRAWYRCASISYLGRRCNNKAMTADALNQGVWDILEVIANNIRVLENLDEAIVMASAEPEEHYLHLMKDLESKLEKNLKNQKTLFEVHVDDKINISVYKEKADELRNEEKQLKTEIRYNQLKLLDNQKGVDNTLRAQGFLSRIKNLTSAEEFTDHDIKEFVRIIFRKIEIEDQKIVSFDLNQPWKYCYEKGVKECQNSLKHKEMKNRENRRSYVVYCSHSAVR